MAEETTLGDLVDRFGYLILAGEGSRLDTGRRVSSVAFLDEVELAAVQRDAIVLGVGLEGAEAIGEALRALATAGATALVVRSPAPAGPFGDDVALLELTGDASWLQLTSMLSSELERVHRRSGNAELGGDAESDLFEIANSLAAVLSGPVTIENMSSRILAFSADQAQSDEPRKQSVLGRQVSRQHNAELDERGIFRDVYSSSRPVYVPTIVEGSRPRTAMRIRAGSENLGSIWVISDLPLSESRQQALVEGANVIGLSLLRRRLAADAGARLRSGLVARLIEGGSEAVGAAEQLGLVGSACVVMAVAHRELVDPDPRLDSELDAAGRAVSTFLALVDRRAIASTVGQTIYAIMPLPGASGRITTPAELATECGRRLPEAGRFVVGASDVTDDLAALDVARRQADLILRVLRLPRYRDRQVAAAGPTEVELDSLLLRLGDVVLADRRRSPGPLARLRDYDAAHDSTLVDTLAGYLEAFGDVGRAATALHIHKNTLRYRLRRISEVAGLDLDDPDTRFAVMIELRLESNSAPIV